MTDAELAAALAREAGALLLAVRASMFKNEAQGSRAGSLKLERASCS